MQSWQRLHITTIFNVSRHVTEIGLCVVTLVIILFALITDEITGVIRSTMHNNISVHADRSIINVTIHENQGLQLKITPTIK